MSEVSQRAPDCAVCGLPIYRHSGGTPNTCPIIATYRPKAATPTAEAGLREVLEGIRDHAKVRIQDGKDLGATVWRLALEDIVRDVDAALQASAPGVALVDDGGKGAG